MQIIDLVPDLRPTILAARQVRDARNSLARFLPVQNVNAVSYRLGRSKRLDQTVPVRANDAPATPIRRPGLVEVRGDLPNVTPTPVPRTWRSPSTTPSSSCVDSCCPRVS
jgi:hypothetical protein